MLALFGCLKTYNSAQTFEAILKYGLDLQRKIKLKASQLNDN